MFLLALLARALILLFSTKASEIPQWPCKIIDVLGTAMHILPRKIMCYQYNIWPMQRKGMAEGLHFVRANFPERKS